jgi:hypothetical protein
VRPGQLTLLPVGQRIRGYTEGLGTRDEVQLYFEPGLVTQVVGSDVDLSRLELVRSMDLRNPSIFKRWPRSGERSSSPVRWAACTPRVWS